MIKTQKKSNNKLIRIGILLFSLFPLLPNNIKGLAVILLLVFSLPKFKVKYIQWKSFFINSSLYIGYLFSFLIFYKEPTNGISILETSLSILVLPFIFFVLIPRFSISNKLKNKFLKTFLFSTTFFVFFTTLYIFMDNETYYYSNWYSNKARTLIEKTPLIGQHPIYASIFSALACLFSIHFFNNLKNLKGIKVLYLLCLLINFTFLILLSSRGVLLALLFCVFLYYFQKIKRKNYKLVLFLILSISFIFLLKFNRRMNELIRLETYTEVNENYSNSYRILIYKCSYNLVTKNFLFGYGLGNVQNELNICYAENGKSDMKNIYNSHNQYFDILLKTGVIGMLLFALFLWSNISIALNYNDSLFLLILIFYLIIFLIENLLLRQSGVVLFYFLVIFFNKSTYSKSSNENS